MLVFMCTTYLTILCIIIYITITQCNISTTATNHQPTGFINTAQLQLVTTYKLRLRHGSSFAHVRARLSLSKSRSIQAKAKTSQMRFYICQTANIEYKTLRIDSIILIRMYCNERREFND